MLQLNVSGVFPSDVKNLQSMLFFKELHLYYQNNQADVPTNSSSPIALKNKK